MTAVFVKGKRPDEGFLPEGTPPEPEALVRRRWDADAGARPTFDAIATTLEELCESVPRASATGTGRAGCKSDGGPPSLFLCEITLDVMERPVLGRDGHTHEEEAIRRWVRLNKTRPVTRAPMGEGDWSVNYRLRQEIEEWVARRGPASEPFRGEADAAERTRRAATVPVWMTATLTCALQNRDVEEQQAVCEEVLREFALVEGNRDGVVQAGAVPLLVRGAAGGRPSG